MVEAAGVEPASESTSPQDSTCVSASEFSCRRVETAKYRRALSSENLAGTRRVATCPPACLMTSGPQPPGEAEADAHSLIRLRERTENPQLTDVPSDLRVNGARHASRDSIPPSKPKSPPSENVASCSSIVTGQVR